MYNYLTRTTGFVLVFGIFFTISCATFQTSSESAEDLYGQNNFTAALEKVDKEISDAPDNHQLSLLKTKILRDFAIHERSPSDREILYQNLRSTADELSYSTDQFTAETDSVLKSAWAHEQGEGVRFLQQDDNLNIDRVIAHFGNAITIIPDSIVTYNLKATTHYRNGDIGKAIETLESIEESGFTRPSETDEKLAYLYLEGGMIDRSIELYEELVTGNPDNEVFRQGLINAYILGDRHQLSIEHLEALSEEYPNRAEYREALATERFYLLQIEARDLLLTSEVATNEVDYFIRAFRDIATMYQDVDSALPSSDERKERISEFHISTSSLLLKIADIENIESEISQRASDEAETHLQDSLPYLRSLFESNADNTAYAQRLIRIYEKLDMEHEAETLERQINF